MDHITLIMGCQWELVYMGSEINMGYDSIFDPRQLNQVIMHAHFLFILIIPSSLFIDKIVLDLLRLYV